jgi:hypothetical protein
MKEQNLIRIQKIAENNQGQIRAVASAITQLNSLTAALFELVKKMPGYDEALASIKEEETLIKDS